MLVVGRLIFSMIFSRKFGEKRHKFIWIVKQFVVRTLFKKYMQHIMYIIYILDYFLMNTLGFIID